MMVDAKEAYDRVMAEVRKHIAGNDEILKQIFIALVANGHVLLEGVPGVAKTTMSKTMAEAISASFDRIQGMPDLEIRDIIGYTYMDDNNNVQLKKGPIFTNILLVDELNRAPPKDHYCAAGSPGRKAGNDKRPDAPALQALHSARHSEPAQCRRHHSAAKGARRQVPDEDCSDLSGGGCGKGDTQDKGKEREDSGAESAYDTGHDGHAGAGQGDNHGRRCR
jgi:MoxR-like ATPases